MPWVLREREVVPAEVEAGLLLLEDDLADDETAVSDAPSERVLRSAAVSMPGVLLTQLAALRALRLQG
ncbi:hypothetical protein, partial [Nocardia carnea]|uniref:hypothetical protein n=1 Tax=Nocardia carnea TaxID=37328 RepID=UPI003D77586E